MKLDLKDADTQAVIFCIFFVIFGIGAIINYVRTDDNLKDPKKFNQIQLEFEEELKRIKLPSKTAINKTENWSKLSVVIRLETRYRTELAENEIIKSFKDELEKAGWIYYGSINEHPFTMSKIFCKGKYDAQLSKEFRSIWNDNADYYRLNISFGHRDLISANKTLPESCK